MGRFRFKSASIMYYYRLISSMLKAVISSLGTGLYAVYKATSIVTTLNTSIFRVYNGDNVNDTSGNAQNGTNVNGVTFTSGKIGNAFTFNGSNYISLPNNSLNLSDTGSNAFSISLWGYLVDSNGLAKGLLTNFFQNNAGTQFYGWQLWHYLGRVQFSRCDGTSTIYTINTGTTPLITMNAWHHIVVTRKNGSTKLYVDSVLRGSDTSTSNTAYDTTHKPLIGARNSYNPDYFDFYIDNGSKVDAVNVWNKELTGSEVTALYNGSTGLEYPFSTAITIDSANDSLATYNGTAQGGLTYTAGKSGNAFTFNGSNAYVSLPNNMFNSFTGDFSINMWVNIVNTGGLQTLLSAFEYNGTNVWGFSLFNLGGTRFDIAYGSTSGVTIQDPSNIVYNTWYMVTITRKASTGTKIYYNGTLAISDSNTINPVYNATTYANIGCRKSSNAGLQYYAGNGTKIDEVNAWNKELTATEITELYNAGAGKFYPY